MRLKVNPASATEIVILGLVFVMVLVFAGFAAIGMWAVFK